jgi:RNA polymerase sigma factor (sigma-70 family)
MKNFNKKIYALNQKSTLAMPSTIPRMYFKMASKIANSFSKEYAAIGVMNINDLNQEAWLALLVTWKNINWEYINSLKTPLDKNKAISKYLSTSIKGLVSDSVKKNADGTSKPIKGIWNNKDKKRHTTGFGFLSVLFPQWFDNEVLQIIDEDTYDYDYEKLGDYLEGWLKKYTPKYHLMIKMFFGLDDIYSKPKKIKEIAELYNMNTESVKKQKQRLINKLSINVDALNELAYFVATNGIKSSSKVYDWAEVNLQIYQD